MLSRAFFPHSRQFKSCRFSGSFFFNSLGKILASVLMVVGLNSGLIHSAAAFDFKSELSGDPRTLGASIGSLNSLTGEITINGGDSAGPETPFDVNWDDGSPIEPSWFPFSHTYMDTSVNYVVTITAHYNDGGSDRIDVPVRFVPPVLNPLSLPPERSVTIDNTSITLVSRSFPGYPAPDLSYFDDSFFDIVPRSAVEYVLHLAAELQFAFSNSDVLEVGGGFQQHVLRDPGAGGMYSIWFTDPVAFGAADYAFEGTIQYSSFFHEMGHNMSLNSPAAYHFGGRIDGSANAIFSETMGQIYQHVTAYVLLNHYPDYGIEATLAAEIEQSARSSMNLVRNSYDQYIAAGAPFTSWNFPETAHDETFGTFMTLAFKFFEHAELAENGYALPLIKMMELLQLFDPAMAAQYAQHSNTPEAEKFRSTLMVAALSYAFNSDLRSEMRALNFPVDDEIHDQLIDAVTTCTANIGLNCPPSEDEHSFIHGLNVQINGVVSAPPPCEPVNRINWNWGDGTNNNAWFPAPHTYSIPAAYTITATALDASDNVLISDSCEISLEVIFKNGFE